MIIITAKHKTETTASGGPLIRSFSIEAFDLYGADYTEIYRRDTRPAVKAAASFDPSLGSGCGCKK
jgi:hypothetical protein